MEMKCVVTIIRLWNSSLSSTITIMMKFKLSIFKCDHCFMKCSSCRGIPYIYMKSVKMKYGYLNTIYILPFFNC